MLLEEPEAAEGVRDFVMGLDPSAVRRITREPTLSMLHDINTHAAALALGMGVWTSLRRCVGVVCLSRRSCKSGTGGRSDGAVAQARCGSVGTRGVKAAQAQEAPLEPPPKAATTGAN